MPTRREVVEQFIPHSPLVQHLGIEVGSLGTDAAELVLPFVEHNITIGEVVHGGAISALADTACMAAAWSNDGDAGPGGATISLSIDFAAPATKTDLRARAEVYHRTKRTCFCRVTVTDEQGAVVAGGLATYRFA